jgi:hypothetical protein
MVNPISASTALPTGDVQSAPIHDGGQFSDEEETEDDDHNLGPLNNMMDWPSWTLKFRVSQWQQLFRMKAAMTKKKMTRSKSIEEKIQALQPISKSGKLIQFITHV